MTKWILQDGDKYFKQWTGIGPMATLDITEAQRFDTKQEAMHSPAYSFSMSFYEPVELAALPQKDKTDE